MFGLTRKPSRRRPVTAPLDLEEAIQIDDIVHGRDRRGYLPDQRSRANLYAQCVNAGVDIERVTFAAWLHEHRGMEG
jgi:hypothetical protein